MASTSPFRRELLLRLRLPFVVVTPAEDEQPRAGESPAAMALRLAEAKAASVLPAWPHAIIIGSDQVAALGDEVLRKPGTPERTVAQLRRLRGCEHQLHTAVCVVDGEHGTRAGHLDTARLWLRSDLSDAELVRYVALDQPETCAGGYKLESLGICLFERVVCDDWTAITGLPLLALSRLLREFGVEVLGG